MNFLNRMRDAMGGMNPQDSDLGIYDPSGTLPQLAPIPQNEPIMGGGGGMANAFGLNPIMNARAAQAQAGATPEQEAMAKKNGFRSYAEMMAWAKARQNKTGGTVAGQGAKPQPGQQPPTQQQGQPTGFGGVISRISNALRGGR